MNKLVDSAPNRLMEVIENKEKPTKYRMKT